MGQSLSSSSSASNDHRQVVQQTDNTDTQPQRIFTAKQVPASPTRPQPRTPGKKTPLVRRSFAQATTTVVSPREQVLSRDPHHRTQTQSPLVVASTSGGGVPKQQIEPHDQQQHPNPAADPSNRPRIPSPSRATSVNSLTPCSSSSSLSMDGASDPIVPPPRPVTLADFEVLKLLGKGSHGKVYLVRFRDDDKLYAMKQLRKRDVVSRKQVTNTLTEFRVNARFAKRNSRGSGHGSPFVTPMHWAFHTRSRLYMVFDYCSGGELFYHIGQRGMLPEQLARFYAAEIAYSLSYLHAHGIVYRDLKPENLLLDAEGHIYLADFGLCKDTVFSPVKGSNSFCGTTEYLAPEVLCNTGHGTAVDWWAFGMVLYEMLVGLPPWYSRDKEKLVNGIMYGKLEFPAHVSPEARSLIKSLLVRDPNRRLGSRGSRSVLTHPFFQNVNWNDLGEKKIKPIFTPPSDTLGSNFDPEFTTSTTEIEKNPQPPSKQPDAFSNFFYPPVQAASLSRTMVSCPTMIPQKEQPQDTPSSTSSKAKQHIDLRKARAAMEHLTVDGDTLVAAVAV